MGIAYSIGDRATLKVNYKVKIKASLGKPSGAFLFYRGVANGRHSVSKTDDSGSNPFTPAKFFDIYGSQQSGGRGILARSHMLG